ncbi:amino acid adenylation domain-containing protein [Kutzneria sp. NPDC052558]|uniref:amino acid adenylation domain-containing protein n=1 Tax=Kutzneria sp. NPDC052558 TaxID=3364121 RepID=UPI0037C5E02A
MSSIARRVHAQALRTPDAVAVVDGSKSLTYAQLDAAAATFAHSLARQGVHPGDAVAIGLPRSWQLVCAMLGVLRLGGQVVPLDRQSPADRQLHMITDSGAVAVVLAEEEKSWGASVLVADDLLAGPSLPAGEPADPAPVAFLFYTSGTTGRPKGVEVRDEGILRLAEPGYLRIEPGNRFACLANPAFDALSFEVWTPLVTGGTVVILGNAAVQDPKAFAAALVTERVDTMFVTAALFNAVTQVVPDCFATVGQVLIGGEQLNAALVKRWYQANPTSGTGLVNGYGPTETTTFALSWPIPRDFDGDVVPIGRPLPATGIALVVPGPEQVVVLDESAQLHISGAGRTAEPGELAELWISGAGLANGYRNLPEETAQRFGSLPGVHGDTRHYRTGDLVRADADGLVTYVGRTDRQVKVRGFRIEPGELEQRILRHPAVRQAQVCVRRAGEHGPNELLAYIVADDLSYVDFDAHLTAVAPAYMRPHHVFRVAGLPRTANGKIDEAALLGADLSPWRPDDTGGEVTPWQREVFGLVGEVLGLADPRPSDTWVAVGGDSLKALRLRFAIRERWGADVAQSTVQHGTFADLATAIKVADPNRYPVPGEPTTALSAPATSEQQRLWLLQQREPESVSYLVPMAFRITGPVDVEAIRDAIRGLVIRHPALRTGFEATADGLCQAVGAPYDPWTTAVDEIFTAPFDLAQPRMLRASWRPEADGGTLLLCLHHIAVDGWSLNVLFAELSAAYAGSEPGMTARSPLDFAAWQAEWFASSEYRAQRDELLARQAELPAAPETVAELGRARLRHTTLDARQRERIDRCCSELGLTRFQLLFGVFSMSLSGVTGRRRLRLAAPTANRPVREFEDSVGMFANTVLLPVSVDPDEVLRDQLGRLGEEAAAVLDRSNVALADVLADRAGTPFDYLFVLENTDFAALRLTDCVVTPQWIEAHGAKCALTLSVVDRETGFDCLWEYGEGHFTAAEIDALDTLFRRALDLLLDGTATPAELAAPYRESLPDHGTGPEPRLEYETVHEGFARTVARSPDAVAVKTATEAITYAQLDAYAAALAATLPEDAESIALYCEPSAEHIVALLALARLNITAVPLDPAYPPALLRQMLAQATPRCVLLTASRAEAFAEIDGTVEQRVITLGAGPAGPVRRAGRPLYTLFTSGSTGEPKGVRVPDRTLANLVQWQDFPPAATQQFSMLSFDVSFQEIVTTLCGGGSLHLIRPEWRHDGPALLDQLETAGIERIFLPYVTLQLLAEHGARLDRFPSRLRDVITAGEQLVCTDAIRRWFTGMPGTRLHNHYGPTETHVATALTLDGDPARWPERPAIGRPVAGAVVRVVDESGEQLPPGQLGELIIGGLMANRCYLGDSRPERFTERPELFYRSGDLAYVDRDGLVHFAGRADGQVKISGHRLELGQVEAALLRHPDVVNAVVVAEETGLLACLECRRTPSAEELSAHLAPLLPAHARVDRFRVVMALPRTPSGKLDRAAAARTAGTDLRRPRRSALSPREQRIAELFEDVTGVPIEPDQTFFAAGASSLGLMRFHLRCLQEGLRFTAADLFEHVTVRELARVLDGEAAEESVPDKGIAAEEPIAVIGMAVRVAGAPDLAAFWDLVRTGRRGIEDFAAEDGLVGARSILDGPLAFDPDRFGISHREAALMDPQQRQLLMSCVEALSHAGIAEPSGRIGLIAGCGENTYFQAMLRDGEPSALPDQFQLALHHDKDFLATKVAYHLNLTGPTLTAQTACSSSLVAVHLAAGMLRSGEADVMLAGGVLVDLTLAEGYRYRPSHIFSPDGHCRPFSADANGTVGASGVGVVVLKPLAQARRDGDTVYSVITGSAVNNDGAAKMSYSAPSPGGQRSAIRAALERSGRTGSDIGYVEAHGTGTRLGDPIEVAALRDAFGPTPAGGCALSSLKSQIGHLGAAAGVVGLIRATLSVHHGLIPPTVDFAEPNPQLAEDLLPFRVPTTAEAWPAGPRVAAVSSFGIGGTNAHVVLEGSARAWPTWEPTRRLVLSSTTPTALRADALRVADYLEAHPESYVDVLRHLQAGRPARRWRIEAECVDVAGAIAFLRQAEPTENDEVGSVRLGAGPAPWDFPPPAFDLADYDFQRRTVVSSGLEVTRLPESEWLHQPHWVRLRRAAAASAPVDRVLVVLSEKPLDTGAFEAVYARVVRIVAGDEFAELGVDEFSANPVDTESLRSVFTAINGDVDFLHALPLGVAEAVDADALDYAQMSCLDAPTAVLRAAAGRQVRTWWLSTQATPIDGTVSRPAAGLLAGVTTVGRQETGVLGHWVDLPDDDLARWASPLAGLLADANAPTRVALRNGFWWEQRLSPVAGHETEQSIVDHGVVLILGGTGAIGSVVAATLLATTPVRVALSARDPHIPESLKPWADRIDLIPADLTTATADEITHRLRDPLTGIVHAAGIAAGGLIARRDPDQARSATAVKLAGAALMERLIERHNPALAVYCSSMSAQLGGVGQLDYAAANGFLDALAHYRSGDGPLRITLDWDIWRDAGMATGVLGHNAQHQAHLAVGLSSEDGEHVLRRALAAGLPQVLVSTTDIEQSRMFYEPVRTTPTATELVDEVRELLGVDELAADVPLYDLGADSLVMLDLIESVDRLFGVRLDLDFLGPNVTLADVQARLHAQPEEIQVWQEGAGRDVLCLIHPVGGDVQAYRPLVSALGPELTVCLIADPALRRPEPPEWSVTERARRYHEALSARFPVDEWRWHLAGWSFGAWVATEMAAQAEAAGTPALNLHLIDPPTPGARFDNYGDAELEAIFERELGATGGTAGEYARRLARACRANLRSMTGHELPRLSTTPSRVWFATEPEGGLPVTAGPDAWHSLLPQPTEWRRLSTTHYGIMQPPHTLAIADAIREEV